MNRRSFVALAGAAALVSAANLHAQFAGAPSQNHFRDTSMLRPPAGQKVAVVVFEDLECPACANAHPIVLKATAQYHVPIVRYDFPLQMHVWSRDAAVFSRYLQDKVNPKLADDYRTAVFAQQISIGGKEDLQNFNRRFLQAHGQSMPFVVDPGGALAGKVNADYQLGERLNVTRTPTIVVVTAGQFQVISGNESGSSDPNAIFGVLEAAEAQTKSAPAARTAPAKRRS